ncbi:2-methylisocitrate lyase-like PEP mutase family enzyme [Marmoricola sp. OAE513]|uniref:isocitrate lyase/PEP mutase family protein n=1 Tax=Marmoricola sp. OAE513 TaxID=2817894 RepID=UPI001AE55565
MTDTARLAGLADDLLALHQPGNPVVLPTAWDAWSANVAVNAGFAAITVGSHPVADSVGRPDGEGMSFTELTDRVAQITGSVDVPVSVDIESGYGLSASKLIQGLLDAGAVGLNIEDTVHSEDGRMRTEEEHAQVITDLRAAADAAGVHVVINARTDTFKNKVGSDEARVDIAIERMLACAEAGADSLYPVGFHDEETLKRLTSALPLPVNAIANPVDGDLAMYARAGAGRISFGPIWQMNLAAVSGEWLARWK